MNVAQTTQPVLVTRHLKEFKKLTSPHLLKCLERGLDIGRLISSYAEKVGVVNTHPKRKRVVLKTGRLSNLSKGPRADV